MALEPEKNVDTHRIIFEKNGQSPTTSKIASMLELGWQSLKMLKRKVPNAIGYIRRKNGVLDVEFDGEIDADILTKALLEYSGIDINKIDDTVWSGLPTVVSVRIKNIFDKGAKKVAKNWANNSEVNLTGKLFENGVYKFSEWTVDIAQVEFSSQTKEQQTGTDVAILIQVKNAQGKVGIKTIWFQAKKSKSDGTEPISGMKDLKDQYKKMLKINKSSYPVIYANNGVRVPLGLKAEDSQPTIGEFMSEAIQCAYGNKNPSIYVESLSRTQVFNILIKANPIAKQAAAAK
jgi:hypothetical protein